MEKTLEEVTRKLRDSEKKVQLIYAFNGTGKTRLSREFRNLIDAKTEEENAGSADNRKILYYNAFTEDLFYWDNDLKDNLEPKLKIHENSFTSWIFKDQGQDGNVIKNFQHYTSDKLNPYFNSTFTEVKFSFERGNDEDTNYIKISKGEESCFVWSVFYSLLMQVIEILNIPEPIDREISQFNNLEYVFIDDPVSSLDDNHLIELAVDLAGLIKSSDSDLKFIITTHNPLFYNVLHNEFKKGTFKKYFLKKNETGKYNLDIQDSDSPFSYHLFLKTDIEKAIETGQLKKYHFNYLRNILEKTSTFLGYEKWSELLPKTETDGVNPYETRIINISSHSKHSADEIAELSNNDKRVLKHLLEQIKINYKFK